MNDIVGTLFVFVMILSVLISAVILLGRGLILDLINIPEESYDMAMEYLVICTGTSTTHNRALEAMKMCQIDVL